MTKITVEILEVIRAANYELIGTAAHVELVQVQGSDQHRITIKLPRDTFNAMAQEMLRRSGINASSGVGSTTPQLMQRSTSTKATTPSNERVRRASPDAWPIFETGAVACDRCKTTGGTGRKGKNYPIRYTTTRTNPPGTFCKRCYNYLMATTSDHKDRLTPEEVDFLVAHGKHIRAQSVTASRLLIAEIKKGGDNIASA